MSSKLLSAGLLILVLLTASVSGQVANLMLRHSAPGSVEVMMTNDVPIFGIQFDVNGPTLSNVFGGSAATAGFSTSFNPANGRVLGFSFVAASIPASVTPRLLVRLAFDTSAPSVGSCPAPGCPPQQACLDGIILSTGAPNPTNINGNSVVCGEPATVTLGATPGPGVTIPINLSSVNDPGAPYLCALTLSPAPGYTLPAPDSRVIPLTYDSLLVLSVVTGTPFFTNYTGVLSASGQATAILTVPNIPAITGFTIYTSFITLSPLSILGIGSIAEAVPITF